MILATGLSLMAFFVMGIIVHNWIHGGTRLSEWQENELIVVLAMLLTFKALIGSNWAFTAIWAAILMYFLLKKEYIESNRR